ncbi:MAG: hypothetical protein NTW13_06075 [Candidatus Omnitrophica bacterium]|nr:hypothetical protein [Candidatus Omnitrophota bacterium]
MKNALILLLVLILVGVTGVLISKADINRTQEMNVGGSDSNYKPNTGSNYKPPISNPGTNYKVSNYKPDPLVPTPWRTANYESRLQYYINGKMYGELRDKITGKIVLVVFLPEGNNTQSIWDVSPDGSTVFYGLGDTVYAQRVFDKQERISTPGIFTGISFNGEWTKLTGTVNSAPGTLWANTRTGEVRTIDPRGTGIDNPMPPMEGRYGHR